MPVSKVMLVVIDGMRPDMLEKAEAPTVKMMIQNGSACLRARSVTPPITLPSHFSIMTGLKPITHGVLTNSSRALPTHEAVSIMDLAKQHGRSTAAFYNWAWLRTLFSPGAADWSVAINRGDFPQADLRMARAAARHLCEYPADFCFLYLGHLDEMGHEHGWTSIEYLEALQKADEALAHLQGRMGQAGVLGDYDWIVLADHGGEQNDHQQPSEGVMTIPWIAWGPSIRQGCRVERQVSLMDTAPTVAALMGLPGIKEWEGCLVKEILLKG
jgi:predicted AlkP superfamily pyrophosphatase or phosphodiesterase